MPSLFSRARTTSTTKTHRQPTDHLDEFGRVPSRGGNDTFPPKKDKNVEKTRTRTLSAAKGRAPGPLLEEDPVIPDGSFFPLNLDPLGDPAGHSDAERGLSHRSLSPLLYAPLHRGFHLPPAVISRVFRFGDRQCCASPSRVVWSPLRASCF